MITDKQKEELVLKAAEYGIDIIFKKLELDDVSKTTQGVYCVCPFHKGADNPTGFYWSNGFGYCFTQCNKSYDLFSIIMKARNCSFPESIDWLSNLIGVTVENDLLGKISTDSNKNINFLSKVKRIRRRRKKKHWEPIDPNVLKSFTPRMHKYLRGRGFNEHVREYFNLGFAQTGYLENRITIPVDYIDGRIVTVSGRSVLPKDELERSNTKRYKIWFNTDKSVTLYNISRALPYIKLTDEVILVEGFASVWRLFQWGYLNAVATMGSSLSKEQMDILLKLGCKIIVCGDRDKAGQSLNKQVVEEYGKLADIEVMDMFLLDVPEKSSIDDITKEQFLYIFNNRH